MDIDIPRDALVVFAGVSGSSKSSLAFGTIFAEAQRRYLDSVAPYARRLFDQVGVPDVDSIEGLPPTVVLQQQRGAPSVRSSVGALPAAMAYDRRMKMPMHDDAGPAALHGMMQLALHEARAALDAGEAPIGCVLLDAEGSVIGAGHNAMRRTGVVTAHAEIKAFEAAAFRVVPGDAYTMVSTLEPCVMCMGAAMQAGVTRIVYGLRAPADAGTTRVDPPASPNATAPTTIGQIGAAESRGLFQQWLDKHAGDESRAAQRMFIEQLLAQTDESRPSAG